MRVKSAAERAYPGYDPHADAARVARRPGINWFSNRPDPSMKGTDVEIVEYSSGEEWHRWVGGQHVNGVEHDLGFNIFDQVAFIPVPDEPFNHGAVEQIVGHVDADKVLALDPAKVARRDEAALRERDDAHRSAMAAQRSWSTPSST